MEQKGKWFDDVARLASSAFATASEMRQAVEAAAKPHIERTLAAMHLVTREEYEVTRQMVAKAREENARLEARIAALEKVSGIKAPLTKKTKKKAK